MATSEPWAHVAEAGAAFAAAATAAASAGGAGGDGASAALGRAAAEAAPPRARTYTGDVLVSHGEGGGLGDSASAAAVDGPVDAGAAAAEAVAVAAAAVNAATVAGALADYGGASAPLSPTEAINCNELPGYRLFRKLGEGTFGKVYLAVLNETGEPFAIKKVPIQYEDEGVPSTAIREISLLRECDHPNVIRLHHVFSVPSMLYLVFEYLDMDLRIYLKRNGPFIDPAMLQSAMFQCTRGLEFCHSHRILHRDLKPQNVLIHVATCRLKLADFGLARAFSVPLRPYTHEVVTLWYRAPEILLGQQKYATPTDIWSLGCILAEMATAQALFPGDSEIDTLFKIFRLLGTPDDSVWPGVSDLRDFKMEFPKWQHKGFPEVRSKGPALGETGISIIRECLRYYPVRRPSCQRLLRFPFFDGADARAPGSA